MAQLSLCPNCGGTFKQRSNKTFCKSQCRKNYNNRMSRQEDRLKGLRRLDNVYHNMKVNDLNNILLGKLYGLPPGERLGYMQSILDAATDVDQGLLRSLLSNPWFIKPSFDQKHLSHRGSPANYCTFPQAANRYLWNSPYRCDIQTFLQGVPEPSTGEVREDGTIDMREGDLGWKDREEPYRDRNGRTRVYARRAYCPYGLYNNDWYFSNSKHLRKQRCWKS